MVGTKRRTGSSGVRVMILLVVVAVSLYMFFGIFNWMLWEGEGDLRRRVRLLEAITPGMPASVVVDRLGMPQMGIKRVDEIKEYQGIMPPGASRVMLYPFMIGWEQSEPLMVVLDAHERVIGVWYYWPPDHPMEPTFRIPPDSTATSTYKGKEPRTIVPPILPGGD